MDKKLNVKQNFDLVKVLKSCNLLKSMSNFACNDGCFMASIALWDYLTDVTRDQDGGLMAARS